MKNKMTYITVISEARDIKRLILSKKSEDRSPIAAYFAELKGVGERVTPLSRLPGFGQFSRSNRLSGNARNSFEEFADCRRRDLRLK